jgi:hypothetical protein
VYFSKTTRLGQFRKCSHVTSWTTEQEGQNSQEPGRDLGYCSKRRSIYLRALETRVRWSDGESRELHSS